MRKGRSWLYVLGVAAVVFLTGCKGEKAVGTAFEILTVYMAENNMDLSDILNGWIIPASTVDSVGTDNYYTMDIRADSVYERGHVPGAVHSSLGNILTDAANSGGKPIIVVCYTGQAAAHAVVALRLSGYADAKVLKFGMSSWNADFDKWTSNTGDAAVGNANWKTDATATSTGFDYPEISTSETDGAAILAEQVNAMLSGGFKGIVADTVLNTPGNYFINNYWDTTAVSKYGHIDGAYRIKENLTITADGFKYLDPNETIVTYCWTGQTSSVVTAYLTVLGYDTKSLKFGTNAMIYSQLEDHKWTVSGSYNYETEP